MNRWGWLVTAFATLTATAAVTFALLVVDTLLQPFFRWPKDD